MAAKATPVTVRSVVVLGSTGAGKSSVANHIITNKGQRPPFRVSASVASGTKQASMSQMQIMDGTTIYNIKMVDTIGFFDTGGRITNNDTLKTIKRFFIDKVPEGVSLVIFVFKKGEYTKEEEETFDFIINNFPKDISDISALVVTCCENLNEAGRQAFITDLKKNQKTQNMLKFMGKGVFTVGFPPLDDMRPELQAIYEGSIVTDQEKLRQLVYSCKEPRLAKKMWEDAFWQKCNIL